MIIFEILNFILIWLENSKNKYIVRTITPTTMLYSSFIDFIYVKEHTILLLLTFQIVKYKQVVVKVYSCAH